MNFLRDDLLERLHNLDLEASLIIEDDRRLQCVLVGGSALVLKHYIDRSTQDIDLLKVSDELRPLIDKYDMNTNVTAYLDSFPESWPRRVERLEDIETRKIDYFIPSLEDLVISKLVAQRPQDVMDISTESVMRQIDWGQLEKLADEVKESLLSDRLTQEFQNRFNTYIADNKEQKRPCGPSLSMGF